MKLSCPGSSEIKSPTPEDIECIFCGFINEIWSDEVEIKCKQCGRMICRNLKNTCIMWCQSAKECIGEEKYNKIMERIKKQS
jgi:hypothetical protein